MATKQSCSFAIISSPGASIPKPQSFWSDDLGVRVLKGDYTIIFETSYHNILIYLKTLLNNIVFVFFTFIFNKGILIIIFFLLSLFGSFFKSAWSFFIFPWLLECIFLLVFYFIMKHSYLYPDIPGLLLLASCLVSCTLCLGSYFS